MTDVCHRITPIPPTFHYVWLTSTFVPMDSLPLIAWLPARTAFTAPFVLHCRRTVPRVGGDRSMVTFNLRAGLGA